MSKSIIQDKKECYICRAFLNLENDTSELPEYGLERHHIMFGYSSKNRKLSEKYGLWVWLCPKHHKWDEISPHKSKVTNIAMRRIAQRAFEQKFPKSKWMELFGKNYIED